VRTFISYDLRRTVVVVVTIIPLYFCSVVTCLHDVYKYPENLIIYDQLFPIWSSFPPRTIVVVVHAIIAMANSRSSLSQSSSPMLRTSQGSAGQSVRKPDCKFQALLPLVPLTLSPLDVYFERSTASLSAEAEPRAKSAQLKLEHYYKVAVDSAIERNTRSSFVNFSPHRIY
jgi:hypothetical protein